MPENLPQRRTLFSRDVDYLRDMFLFWPFVLHSILAIACAFSPADRNLALRFGAVAIASLLLAREKVLLCFASLGFIAVQSALNLALHQWSWGVFAAGAAAGLSFLLGERYWRRPKLSYRLPTEFRLLDALWSVFSLCASFFLLYLFAPRT